MQVLCSKFVSTAIQWEEDGHPALSPLAPPPAAPSSSSSSGNRQRSTSSGGGEGVGEGEGMGEGIGEGEGGELEALTLALLQADRMGPALGMYKVGAGVYIYMYVCVGLWGMRRKGR